METLQVGLHVLAHSGLSIALGSTLERIFPAYNPGRPSIIQIAEAGVQLTLSTIVLSELMRLLSPGGTTYVSPIGDGFAAYFLLDSQPGIRLKLYRGISLAMGAGNMDVKSGTMGATTV